MIPSVREVIVQRHLLRGLIRLISLPCFFLALWPWSSWLMEGLRDGDLFDFGYYWGRIVRGAWLSGSGAALLVFNRWLVLWMIPMPRAGECPACGFSARGLSVPRCPECGLDLPPDLISSAVSEVPPAAPPAGQRRPSPE